MKTTTTNVDTIERPTPEQTAFLARAVAEMVKLLPAKEEPFTLALVVRFEVGPDGGNCQAKLIADDEDLRRAMKGGV